MNVKKARGILEVPLDATVDEIRSQYYQRAKQTHPDSTGTGDAAEFIRLRAAYEELLRDPKEVGRSEEDGGEAETGDFKWEWDLRKHEIQEAFEQIRQFFHKLRLSDELLGKLARRIRTYTTAAELRRKIKDDAQDIARDFIKKTRTDVARKS